MIQEGLYQTIELFIACRKLKDLDFFSKSDPYVKVSYRRDFTAKNFLVLGRTETAQNELNPTFTKSFTLDFVFESRQDIKFEVFDDDNGNDDFIGSVETTVGALMGTRNQTSILQLTDHLKKKKGTIIIRCEPVASTGICYEMKWRAEKLMNTDSYFDFWDKSDPYLKFLKIRADNTLIPIHTTEHVPDNLNPSWRPFFVDAGRLHSEDSSRFKLECWDWEKSGKDQFIGESYLESQQLMTSNFPLEVLLTNPKSKKPGKLVLESFRKTSKPTFVDYLRGGLQLNMIVAIDFTGSNGEPHSPSSLHYMNESKPNQYQVAIEAIGQILLNYDSDKRIPAFGFGAQLSFPKMKGMSHCFPLSGDFKNVDSVGLQHMMSLYASSLKNLSFSGPTYFGPIIEHVSKMCHQCKATGQHIYQTLLILTDGQIDDMQKVVDLIIECAQLPLSIIIVGVGSANFSNMERLDGDDGLCGSKGQKAPRDIVQFVPFRDVKYSPDYLAKQLLAELPAQVVQYFQGLGVPPRAPQNQPNMSEVMMEGQQFGNKEFAEVLGQGGLLRGG